MTEIATKDANQELAVYAAHLLDLCYGGRGLSLDEFSALLRKKAETLSITLSDGEVKAFHVNGRPSRSAASWEIRGFEDAMSETLVKPPWVIENLLAKQSATLVAAHPHALKSLSWLYASLEAVAKKQVWGRFAAPDVESTLFIETEDAPWLVEARIRGFAKGLGLTQTDKVPGFHYACVGPFALLSQEENIRGLIRNYGLSFITISTLQNLLGARAWKAQEEMQPILSMIVRLSRECPIVLLTHSPWDKKQRRAAGSVTIPANFLTTLHCEKTMNRKSNDTFVHILLDSKASAAETSFNVKLLADGHGDEDVRGIEYVGSGWPKGGGKAAVLAAVEEDPDASPKEIADRTGMGVRYVQRIMSSRGGEMRPLVVRIVVRTHFGRLFASCSRVVRAAQSSCCNIGRWPFGVVRKVVRPPKSKNERTGGGCIATPFVSIVRFEGNRGLQKPTEQSPLEARYE